MSTLSIKMLMDNNFSQFNHLTTRRKANQIEKIRLIDRVARSLELEITELDLKRIFPHHDDGSIAASPREVNRILANFEIADYNEELAEELENFELTSRQIGAVNRAASTIRNRAGRDLENERTSVLTQLNNANRQVLNLSSRALNLRRQIENTNGTYGDSYVDHIKRIIATGNWLLDSIGATDIIFTTRNDIINTFTNRRADIDLRVNLGKFKLKIGYENLTAQLINFQGNIDADGYSHPHYSGGGACLGNLGELYMEAQTQGDLFTIVDLNHKLLTNYNDANPYVALADFARISGQVQPNGEVYTGNE